MLHRTYAKVIIACGSMVLFFFCGSFFAWPGEKMIHKGREIPGLRKSYYTDYALLTRSCLQRYFFFSCAVFARVARKNGTHRIETYHANF